MCDPLYSGQKSLYVSVCPSVRQSLLLSTLKTRFPFCSARKRLGGF